MFLSHQVEIRDAEIYSSMPDKYRRPGVASEWAKANRGGKTLYCTEPTSGSILTIPMQHAGVPLAR